MHGAQNCLAVADFLAASKRQTHKKNNYRQLFHEAPPSIS
jgi:hypothetical protein